MEPKAGRLHKLSQGLFGPKWTEKWAHLDGRVLKYLPMGSEPQVFSLSSASSRQTNALELKDYVFAVVDDSKKINRKFAFQLVPKEKSLKPVTFACPSEQEFAEWKQAFQSRSFAPPKAPASGLPPALAEKLRRAEEAFSSFDPRRTDKIEVGTLPALLQMISFPRLGDPAEVSRIQLQLDVNSNGRITRDRFLSHMKWLYLAQESESSVSPDNNNNNQPPVIAVELPEKTSDQPETHEKELTFDWNDAYAREIKALPRSIAADSIARGIRVATFLKGFREQAEQVVSQIIHEIGLSDHEKTVTPLSLENDGFLATDGDERLESRASVMSKFAHNGMEIYLVTGNDDAGNSSLQIVLAHKLLGHEIRAARALQEAIEFLGASSCRVSVPLQCTIDYLGYRAYVVASTNGLVQISRPKEHDGKSDSFPALKRVFDALKLFTDGLHERDSAREFAIPSFFPRTAGLETTKGSTKVTLRNIGDLFPADLATLEVRDQHDPAFALTKLRPEFVNKYGDMLPLHSNAHLQLQAATASSSHQMEVHMLQQAAISAREHLQNVVIPEFVQSIEDNELQVFDSRSLTHAMHDEGINVRYLGLCYELSTVKHVRRLFLTEMIARACKIELAASLRSLARQAAVSTVKQANAVRTSSGCCGMERDELHDAQEPMDPITSADLSKLVMQSHAREVAVDFFNLALGSSVDSRCFYKDRVLPHVCSKFGLVQTGFASLEQLQSEELVHSPQLFLALQIHTNARFSDHMQYNFKAVEPFSMDQLESLEPSTNLLARTLALSEQSLEQINSLVESNKLDEAIVRLKFHLAILDTAPNDERAALASHLLSCIAELTMNKGGQLDQARALVNLAIDDGPKSQFVMARAHTLMLRIKHQQNESIDAISEHYRLAVDVAQWHLGAMHPLLYDTHMTMLEIFSNRGMIDAAIELHVTCVNLVRDCFGKTSLMYADVRRQQGFLLHQARRFEEGVGVLEDAVAVYERHFHDAAVDAEQIACYKSHVACCCDLIADALQQQTGKVAIELAYQTALRALTLRKEACPQNLNALVGSFLQLGGLAKDLSDSYRAIEYLQAALSLLKETQRNEDEGEDEDLVVQIRSTTQTLLHLHFQNLASEKLAIVDRTIKRFAVQMMRFAEPNEAEAPAKEAEEGAAAGNADSADAEAKLLRFVIKQLLMRDPIEYAIMLVDKTDQELQDYRMQYTMNRTGSVRSNADGPASPQLLRMASPTARASRFASFSSIGTLPGGGGAPCAARAASPRRSSFNQADTDIITTASGEFTFGGQLAAVLFLKNA